MELLHSIKVSEAALEVIRAAIINVAERYAEMPSWCRVDVDDFQEQRDGLWRAILTESQMIQIANGLVLTEPRSLGEEGSAAWVEVVMIFERHLGRNFTQY